MSEDKVKTKREEYIEAKALEAFKRIFDEVDGGLMSYTDFVLAFKAGYKLGQSDTEETIIVI